MESNTNVTMEMSFPMNTALRLASWLNELRVQAEYLLCGEKQEEFPDAVLLKEGEDILEVFHQLKKDMKKIEEMVAGAKERTSGPISIVKKREGRTRRCRKS